MFLCHNCAYAVEYADTSHLSEFDAARVSGWIEVAGLIVVHHDDPTYGACDCCRADHLDVYEVEPA